MYKTPMGKTSTLIYLYSNFDELNDVIVNNDVIIDEKSDLILNFIKKHTKKVPDKIVNDIVELAKKYS